MIKTLILRYVAGNLDKLIDFLNSLDAQLDQYVQQQTQKYDSITASISQLRDEQDKVQATTNTAQNLRVGLKGITSN